MHRTLIIAALVALSSRAAAADLLPPDRPIAEAIDHYIDLKLKQSGVTPAPQADDSTLVRRLTLDLAGRIPTPAEVRAYLDSKDSDKRAKLIDRLMASPEYVRHSATEFDTMLRNGSELAPSVRDYLLVALKENRPWDRMFRELMGTTPRDPLRPERFVLNRLGDLDVLTRDVSSVFFGVNVMCAQCHKHPYVSSITQDYYYGMKAFFARSIDFQGELRERQYALVQYKAKSGEVRTPKLMFLSGTVLDEPKPEADINKAIQEETKQIDELRKNFGKGKEYPPQPTFSYRQQLAEVALRRTEQDRFARSIVNRLWYRFHGYGLVMRLDQMHAKNPPNHPELLEWLARDFIAHKYDLRRLVSGLVSSQTYSRSSRWDKGEAPDPELFAVANLRPLTPRQFGVSVLLASNPDALPDNLSSDARDKQLAQIETEALRFFGTLIEQPQDGLQINVVEALKLSNDETLLRVLGDKLVARLVKSGTPPQQVEAAVWAVLSRPPSEGEVKVLSDYLARHIAGDAERERLAQELREKREAVERARHRVATLQKEIADLLNRHRAGVMRSTLEKTADYLAAAAELRLVAPGVAETPEKVAARHGLDAELLRRWHAYLNRPIGNASIAAPQADEAIQKGLYTAKVNNLGGNKTVNGWGSFATPWIMANSGRQEVKIGTLTLPPRSISTHPSQTLSAAVALRSPVAATVNIIAKVADIDPNCGNGVGWSIELLHNCRKQILASGVIDNGKRVTLDFEKMPELAAVKVELGDLLSLVIDPRDRDHSCDSTHIELGIIEEGGKGRKWDLTPDVVDSIQAANPHADGQGNAQVWYFYTIAGGAAPAVQLSLPAGSLLARWSETAALLQKAKTPDAAERDELRKIAATVQKVLLGPAAPMDGANGKLYRELTAANGPLFNGVDFSTSLNAEAKDKLAKWSEELAQVRKVATQQLPATTDAEEPAQRALRQMVWALLTGAEFRFNY